MLDSIKTRIQAGCDWYKLEQVEDESQLVCRTRDVLNNKIDRLYKDVFSDTKSDADSALVSAVAGEIGNNCFDHNLGQWRDVSGCWFEFGIHEGMVWVVIADRGQGVLSSLRRVDKNLTSDQEALETAFQKRISGRSPEKRGNGLKFVRQVIHGNGERSLFFCSGAGSVRFGGLVEEAKILLPAGGIPISQGAFAFIVWRIYS